MYLQHDVKHVSTIRTVGIAFKRQVVIGSQRLIVVALDEAVVGRWWRR